MKKDLHPQEYRDVVFMDEAVGFSFLTKSTVQTDETVEYNGKTYPLVKIYISSKSHPFFTGEEKIIDTEGRVDRFAAKMKAAAEAKAKKAEKMAKKTVKKAEPKAESSTSVEDGGAVIEKNIDPVVEKVADATDNAADAVTETIENVAEKAEEIVEKIAGAKDEAIEKVADTAKEAVKKADEKLNDKKVA